ncbi:hypothetical protein M3484_20335 [Pseudomonas sp. GX19020]|uniref:DUF6878 family protein n=1 Tax=Pseudomonas sp. GX19020 TaxID=2942277 RepID=UPI00201A1A35|nr:DUF6878 family protein [Pseudomonas sp. GX19020]MCL4068912.1 hypothetical protein [Pseudomonas sp. GX19020]
MPDIILQCEQILLRKPQIDTHALRQAAALEATGEVSVAINKQAVFDALTAAGITHAAVEFDNIGIHAHILSVDVFDGVVAISMPSTVVAITSCHPEGRRCISSMGLADAIMYLASSLLAGAIVGLEDQDCSRCTFCFDAVARTIQIDFDAG